MQLKQTYKNTQNFFNINSSVFFDYHNMIIDFKKLLKNNNTIFFKNCHNINIHIHTNINNIHFINCTNIIVYFKKIIGGITSKNSYVKLYSTEQLYNLDIEYSTIFIYKHIFDHLKYKSIFKSNVIFNL